MKIVKIIVDNVGHNNYTNTCGENYGDVTPVPIPNTEVKLSCADDSWGLPPVKIGIRQFFNGKDNRIGCLFVYHKYCYFFSIVGAFPH